MKKSVKKSVKSDKASTKKVQFVKSANNKPVNMEVVDDTYNRKQAAHVLGISIYAVDQLILKNKLKSLKVAIVKQFKAKK